MMMMMMMMNNKKLCRCRGTARRATNIKKSHLKRLATGE